MTRRENLIVLSGAAAGSASLAASTTRYEIGAYYFPNYHVDARNEAAHGRNWTEWELVKRAEPRFLGHRQPRRPLWGYQDESDPHVFARKIDAAADHGLTNFIFDWYWYNDGPFLNRCLDRGYLGAANNIRLKFCLMWANHDWLDIMPAKLGTKAPLQYPGAVTPATFDRIADHVIEHYFRHPSYWKIDGRPYFSIYELFRFVEGCGGLAGARAALDRFREKARSAGLPGVHLNAVLWGVKILPGEKAISNPREMLAALGFDSTTSYVWVHHVALKHFPTVPYEDVAREAIAHWSTVTPATGLPYYPNVSVGWDPSPRTAQSDKYEQREYPFTPVISGSSPAAFRSALQRCKKFLDTTPNQPKILNLNSWNEWTEGSYLEPDDVERLGYLEAVRDVFSGT